MKTYFRILSFANPLYQYAVPYFLFSILGTAFGLANFTLLIPLLDVLFNHISSERMQYLLSEPVFGPNLYYITEVFYYYFAWIMVKYGKIGALQFVCVTIVGSVLLSNIFNYMSVRVMEYMRANTIRNVRQAIFDRITELNIGYFTSARKGDIISRTTSDVYELESTISNSLNAFFKENISLIGFFVALFFISVELTVFTLITIPISAFIIAAISRTLRRQANESQASLGNLVSILDETIGGLRIIKAFNATEYIRKKFNKENDFYAGMMRAMARTREMAGPTSEFLGVCVVAVVLLYGGSLVLGEKSTLSASAFVAYIILFSQVLRPAKGMSVAFSNIQRGLAAGQRIFVILDTKPQIVEKHNAVTLRNFESEIEFRDVSFRYKVNEPVLHQISFTLEKGKTLALVGSSGSGKSTIADLIPRFYDVEDGEILIDGVNIKDCTLASLIDKMGIVTQEPILFNDTIFNNIAFARPESTMDEVINAAKIANAHEFIIKKDKGYEFEIGDRGAQLSGGQRQRISIARAVLKNPPILILDEATSALDTKSEKLVQDALNKLMQNRTSLIIAHRLSTIQHADQILVIQDGEIVERGSHKDLIERNEGLYRKLNLMQS
jgi:ATP-binding cassette, subfamily B, bacterial MsbA